MTQETKFRETFTTPYLDHADREGQPFTVVRQLPPEDNGGDPVVGIMWRIKFSDGVEIDAWPEEVIAGG